MPPAEEPTAPTPDVATSEPPTKTRSLRWWLISIVGLVLLGFAIWQALSSLSSPEITALKVLGPIFLTVSALWNMFFEQTRKNEGSNVKSLYKTGYFSIGLILVVFGLNVYTPIQEQRARDQKDRADREAGQVEKVKKDAEERRAKAQARNRDLEQKLITARIERKIAQQLVQEEKGRAEVLEHQRREAQRILANQLTTEARQLRGEVRRSRGVMKAIWSNGEQVEAADITVVLEVHPLEETKSAPPIFFEDNATVELTAARAAASRGYRHRPSWLMEHFRNPELGISFVGKATHTMTERRTVDGPGYVQRSTFAGFTGDLGSFRHRQDWNGALVQLTVTGNGLGLIRRLEESFSDEQYRVAYDDSLVSKFQTEYGRELIGTDANLRCLPALAWATIFVKQKPIVRMEIPLVTGTIWDEDVHPQVYARFHPTRVAPSLFSTFNDIQAAGSEDPDTTAEVGWPALRRDSDPMKAQPAAGSASCMYAGPLPSRAGSGGPGTDLLYYFK